LFIACIGVAAMAKYVEIVMTEEIYCMICHSKERYLEQWHKSKVHPDIKCADCHGRPEEIMKFNLSANQDVTSKNCIRCHKDIIKTDKKDHFEFNEFNILIPHKLHFDNNILCTDCHSNIRHEKRKNGTYRPTMKTCFSKCHPKEKTLCTQCHPHGSLELPRNTHITEIECKKCHIDIDDEDKEFTIFDTIFSHEPHREGGVECEACHSNAEKHGEIILDREGCQECHEL
jgi:hypothetical protein